MAEIKESGKLHAEGVLAQLDEAWAARHEADAKIVRANISLGKARLAAGEEPLGVLAAIGSMSW